MVLNALEAMKITSLSALRAPVTGLKEIIKKQNNANLNDLMAGWPPFGRFATLFSGAESAYRIRQLHAYRIR